MPLFAGAVLLCPIILASLCYQGHGTVDPILVAVLGAMQMALLFFCQGGLQARPVLQQGVDAADSNMHTGKPAADMGQKPYARQLTMKRPVPEYRSLYASKLQQCKVAIKIRSDAKPGDLPNDMAQRFQEAFEEAQYDTRPTTRMQLTGMAVRSGCVLFSLDLVAQDQSSSAADCTAPNQQQAVLANVLKALKPTLQQIRHKQQEAQQFKKGGSTQHGDTKTMPTPNQISPVGPEEDMIVQVDDASWTVTWDSNNDCWQACPDDKQSASPSTTLGLVQLIKTTGGTANTAPEIEDSRNCKSSQHVTADLLVQLWDLQGEAVTVGGWMPPTPGTHVANNGLKVLAHMDGRYLQTNVTPAAMQCSASVPARATMMQVEVLMPSRVSSNSKQLSSPPNSHDHNHAPYSSNEHSTAMSQCQLLTLELWCDEQRLSNAYVVIPAQQRTCWLWESSKARSMRRAMTELSSTEQQLWGLGAAIRQDEVTSWQDLQHDLCMWLRAVRLASGTGRCYPGLCRTTQVVAGNTGASGSCYEPDMPADFQNEAGFQPQIVLQLGTDLVGYMSDQASLACLRQMVAHQLKRTVQPWAERQSRRQPLPKHFVTSLFSVPDLLCTACFGYSCPTCEAAYKAHLSQMLAGYQAVAATFLLLIACMALANAVLRSVVTPVHVLFLTWAVSCVFTIVHHIMPQHRQHPSCSKYGLWAWVSRLVVNVCLGLQWATPYHKVVKSLSMYLLTHFLIAIGEQLPSESLVPSRVTCILVLLDLPGLYLSAFLCQVDGWTWFGAVAGLLVAVVVGPRLLSMQLRLMLESNEHLQHRLRRR